MECYGDQFLIALIFRIYSYLIFLYFLLFLDDPENIPRPTNIIKEGDNLEQRMSSNLHEENKHPHGHGFFEKLRDVFSTHH